MRYEERSRLIKALSEQEYFDAQTKQPNTNIQIGAKRGDTGRYEVIHNDGGATSNGDKIFNSSAPQDGFVRGNANGNAIALEHRNYKEVDEFINEIEEDVEEPLILVSYDLLGFFIFSGNGLGGEPRSTAQAYTDRSSLPIDSQDGVIYTIDTNSGVLALKEGALTLLAPTGNDPLNSINKLASTYFQDFEGENNQLGITISGSYIDHTGLTPPSRSLGYAELSLKFNLLAQTFLKEWDVLGEVLPIEAIDNEIDRLDGVLDLERRAITLTKAIIDTGLDTVRDNALTVLAATRISLGNPFFGIGLEFALTKVFELQLPVLPPIIPPLLPTDEFFDLAGAISTLITRLNTFIATPDITNVSLAESQARKCTKEGERVAVLNTFFSANSFTNYTASINSSPFDEIFLSYYERTWDTAILSPFEFEAVVEGVPLNNAIYFVSFIRQDIFYYVYTYADALGIPFSLPQYRANFRWRKRGNTEWFSI